LGIRNEELEKKILSRRHIGKDDFHINNSAKLRALRGKIS